MDCTGMTGSGILAFFLFQMVFMDTAATIPTGSMAERLKFSGFVLMGFWVSMFIYPLLGNWVWGGGWLQNLGRSLGFGNGAVDFAGSGVVHMIGGSMALAGAIVIGPRIGRFNKDGSANAMPGHNIPMGVLGTIILFFGWFGFNPGSSLAFMGGGRELAVLAAVNTLLAGAAGGMSSMLYMWWFGPDQEAGSGPFGQRHSGRTGGDHSALRICIAAGFRCDRTYRRRIWCVWRPSAWKKCTSTILSAQFRFISAMAPGDCWQSAYSQTAIPPAPDGMVFNRRSLDLIHGGSTQIIAQGLEVVSIIVVAGGLSYRLFQSPECIQAAAFGAGG